VPQFSAECGILSQATEFAHFCGISTFHAILQNLVLAGDKGTNTAYFCWVHAAIENYLLQVDMMHCEIHDRYSSSNGRNVENIELI